MAKYSVLDYAVDVLKTAKTPLVFQEIWHAGQGSEFASKLNLKGKTPWATLGARLFVEVRDNPNSQFLKVGQESRTILAQVSAVGIDSVRTQSTQSGQDKSFRIRIAPNIS